MVAQRSETVKRYIEDTGLPFNILVDESRDVLKAYGVWQRIGLDAWNIARPALFLIDPTARSATRSSRSRRKSFRRTPRSCGRLTVR